jgi:hypothetical protein
MKLQRARRSKPRPSAKANPEFAFNAALSDGTRNGTVSGRRIATIKLSETIDLGGELPVPGFVEAHGRLDTACNGEVWCQSAKSPCAVGQIIPTSSPVQARCKGRFAIVTSVGHGMRLTHPRVLTRRADPDGEVVWA